MGEKHDGVYIRKRKPGIYELLTLVQKNTILIANAVKEGKEVRLYIGADNDLHIIASPVTELEFRR